MTDKQLSNLIDVLGSQAFADFYDDNGLFGEWLSNGFEPGSMADTAVRERLTQLFSKVVES